MRIVFRSETDVMDRAKYFLLCVLTCVLYVLFAGIVALKKSQFSSVDRALVMALAFALPAWFLLTTALTLLWRRHNSEHWRRAAIFDLLFYAFLPVTAGGICAVELLGELSLVRVFIIVAALKALATVYSMARASSADAGLRATTAKSADSGSSRWPSVLLGSTLSLGVILSIVAISGQREHITAAIKFGPETFLTAKDHTLSSSVKEGTHATSVRLQTELVHSGGILQGAKIAHLKVTDRSGARYDFAFLAGVHASEKCYEIPNTRTHIRHLRSHAQKCNAEFLAHGQTYMGRACSATFSFGKRIEPQSVEVFFSLDDPEQQLLRICIKKVLFLDR